MFLIVCRAAEIRANTFKDNIELDVKEVATTLTEFNWFII